MSIQERLELDGVRGTIIPVLKHFYKTSFWFRRRLNWYRKIEDAAVRDELLEEIIEELMITYLEILEEEDEQ